MLRLLGRLVLLLLLGSSICQAAEPLEFSTAEARWLQEHGRIRVGLERKGWPPFDLMGEDGSYQGISADFLRLLGERLGLGVEPVYFDDWPQAREALRRGEVDVVPSAAKTPERERWMAFSDPYLTTTSLIYSRRETPYRSLEELAGRRVAVERGYAMEDRLRQRSRDLQLVETSDTEAALRALSSGRADAYVGNMMAAGYLIHRLNLSNLEVSGDPAWPAAPCTSPCSASRRCSPSCSTMPWPASPTASARPSWRAGCPPPTAWTGASCWPWAGPTGSPCWCW